MVSDIGPVWGVRGLFEMELWVFWRGVLVRDGCGRHGGRVGVQHGVRCVSSGVQWVPVVGVPVREREEDVGEVGKQTRGGVRRAWPRGVCKQAMWLRVYQCGLLICFWFGFLWVVA